MKKLLLLAASLLSITATSWAEENTPTEIQVNGAYYQISNGEATLSWVDKTLEGDYIIPSEIEFEGNSYPVTSIRDYAFYNWSGEILQLTSIQIPSSVVTIGDYAFGNTAITEMEIPFTVKKLGSYIFSQCPNLKKVVINGGIEDIGESFFSYNGSQSLEMFVLGEGHTSVPTGACQNCVNLSKVVIPSTVTTISDNAFNGCVGLQNIELPEGVTTLERSVFAWCEDLNSIKLPSTLKKIGLGAFFHCTSLKTLDIPENVLEIGTFGSVYTDFGCFASCTSLKELNLGNNLKIIGPDSFNNCTSLTNVELPSTVESIGNYAFSNCTSLKSITIGKSLATIGESCFNNDNLLEEIIVNPENEHFSSLDGFLCNYEKSRLIFAPKSISGSITIPSSIRTLGTSAFQNCEGITSLILNEGLETIMDYAISQCSNLHDLKIPASVSSIYLSAFTNNNFTSFEVDVNNQTYSFKDGALCNLDGTELLEWLYEQDEIVTIPNSVISIGVSAFSSLNLREINFNENLQSIDNYAFYGCKNLKKVSIPNSVSYIGEGAFESSGLVEIDIPNSVSNIGKGAFRRSSLVEIEFPSSLAEITSGVCASCYQLTSVKLPESLVNIGTQAFFDCRSLESVVIPKNVRSIDELAFWSNTAALKKLRCLPLTPPEIISGASTFGYGLTVEVYESALDAYKTDFGWGESWNYTYIGIPDEVVEVENISDCVEDWTVHSIEGRFVMQTNDKSRLNSLPKGIYIINGKKVIK